MKKLAFVLLIISASAHAQLTSPAPQILVPAAGSVPGSNGTFFRSDIAIFNYRNVDQNVLIQWLPQGTSGVNGASNLIIISAFSGVISQDFVANVLHQSGLGAIVITAVNGSGQMDANAALFVTSRIWTPEPNKPEGTNSQSFPAIDTSKINSSNVAILGQRISDQYRANVGIVNLSTATQTFEVLQNSDDPTFAPVLQTVVVAPQSMQQISLLNTRAAALQIRVRAVTVVDPRLWVAYGSSVDNVTGDSWSSPGITTLLTP